MLALSMAGVLFIMNMFKVGIVGAMRSNNTLSKVSLSLMGVYVLSFVAFFFMINNV
jgi:quinol-cytochrome oxidoreductase complex cytochrome b subunit